MASKISPYISEGSGLKRVHSVMVGSIRVSPLTSVRGSGLKQCSSNRLYGKARTSPLTSVRGAD